MVTRALLIEAGPTPWDKEGRLVGNRPLPLATDALDAIRHLLQTIHEPVQGLYKPHGNEACDAVAKLLTQTFSLRAKEMGELDELDLGLWEGLKPAEVRSRFPRVFAQWMEKPLEVTPPDGEQLDKAIDRLTAGTLRILKRSRGLHVALVLRPMALRIVSGVLQKQSRAEIASHLHDRSPKETIEVDSTAF